ncbi:MAG: deoxyhypusine synthase [Deltaproteobacteria bacterium GWC2_42_51]|nr:MAG: deoxyhypusine synthase [Deltaproteobacteria bacterium GWC2_42_51]OGP40024.1 MAG: deoxyhypusine synthase [Deltaproteobacteria bacterium GWD2_42_10]OGP46194.1 MAG: deoxyhypusine synthase [Deltaproteobacteria bacterium GWF2_42_12]OGQ24084.1 MAG: deoxyhypusine synthase [Deltaproteobacteria bacterium RIFCSPHIGHO2_02_FULL_42_44]OGQ35326.1 MAG: deoxyhypusine synthase [Deltaproteobacteria bacterium RIFCSPLOWO2_02_FULL_42_39]OGQ69781.1 MAG: deoxyhypusine synthase [Deltaproteobacteria bacterium 
MAKKRFLKRPVKPVEITPGAEVSELLDRMADTAFQGKNLAVVVDAWEQMLRDNVTIFFGLAGAMIPAGMRRVIVYLIKNRLIDCLVSTGANLFHDIHETLGRYHWQGSAMANDEELRDEGIDRIYDVFAIEREFEHADVYCYKFSKMLERRPYTTREFLYLLGKQLSKGAREDGILTAAYKANIPVYCPAIGDSSIGIGLAIKPEEDNFIFDVIGDVKETALIAANANKTGVIYIGGGTPKNFIQQTSVTAAVMGKDVSGHEYAVQITTDAPHWGGLSGCTFEEAQSWGKIAKKAKMVTVHCDSTIALPIIVTALAKKVKGLKRKPKCQSSKK